MFARYSLLALVPLCVLPAGCPVLDVEADVAEVCVTYPGLAIAGVPAGAPPTIDATFVVTDLGAIQSLAKLDADLEFVRADVHAVTGITDFAFVQAAHVAIASGDSTSTLPTLDVYDCDGECAPAGADLAIPAVAQTSALAYVQSGSVLVDLALTGTPPTVDWSMDVEVCFRGHVAYQAAI